MHWVDVYSEKLLSQGKVHLVESGTSISGQPHLGSAEDIIIADGISKAINEQGGESRTIWAMDDMDGLRKIPEQLPKEFEEYLGQPAYKLPCPEGCCDSFREHFTRPFLESLERIDVKPEPISVAKMYQDGKYDRVVTLALERAQEIKDIMRDMSGSKRDDDWLPFFAICENCGKILSTKTYEFNGQKVKYLCQGGIAGKNEIPGCGHEGEVGIRQGKLPWRVEWAARWSHLGVTCEPMGKDLMAAGGTYETGKAICERIFDSPAPMPVSYEWIVGGDGKRLGKSAGRILTLAEMIDIASPEISRYFFFRSQPSTHKTMDFEFTIPKLAEDYEMSEKVYFGLDDSVPEKELEDIKRNYEVSQVGEVSEAFFQVPYSHLVSVVQTCDDWDSMVQTLTRTGHMDNASPTNLSHLTEKVDAVKTWLATRAPENVKFSIQEEPPGLHLFPDEIAHLRDLLSKLQEVDWKPDLIHDAVYSVAVDADIKVGPIFKIIYRIFLARDRGPRLGFLLSSLGKEFVIERIKHFTK